MITVLTGKNSFELQRALDAIVNSFDGHPERFDGDSITRRSLPDLLTGGNLFAEKRLIIIRSLSDNHSIWSDFADWLPKVSDDIHLVLIEPNIDKRTKTFKALKKTATLKDFPEFDDHNSFAIQKWFEQEIAKRKLKIDKANAQLILNRAGFNQWQLSYALDKLNDYNQDITAEVIANVIDANLTTNVFDLLKITLQGNLPKMQEMLGVIKKTNDPFQLFGLLSTQVFQLAVLANAKNTDNISQDFAIHPYVIAQSTNLAKQLGKSGTKQLVEIFARADDDLKLSKADPWTLIERALITSSQI